MGSVQQLPSGRWRAVTRINGKQTSLGTYDTKTAAQHAANQQQQTPTWAQWETTWTRQRTVTPGTIQTDRRRIQSRIKPKWGDQRLDAITPAHVQQWVAELIMDGLQPNTVSRIVHVFSGSMTAARKAKIIEVNPASGVSLPKPGPTPERFLTDQELAAMRAELEPRHHFLFDLLLGAGLRIGEARALHWEDVDLKSGTLRVVWAYDREDDSFKSPKSLGRRIPLGKVLVAEMNRMFEADGWGTPETRPYRGARKPHTGLVTHTSERTFRADWERARKIASVGGRQIGSPRIHDLRHTYASRLVQAGVPLQEVARLLGDSMAVAQRYAHLAESQFDLVRGILDRV